MFNSASWPHFPPWRAAFVASTLCAALSGCSDSVDSADGSPMSDATPSTDTFVEDIRGTDAFIEPDIRGTDGSVDAPETPGFDARRDTPAEGGSEAGDGGDCSLDPVWNAASLTFTFTSSGGFVPPPPPDAGCSLVSARYDFVSTERTLTHRGCTFTGPINRIVHLTGAQYDAILARVSALRTTCTKGCGADYPNVVLTVAASGVATTYNSNFYAGCAGSPLLPPFIAFDMLGDLHGLLNATVSAACNLDAGSGDAGEDSGDASAGSCIALPSQDAGIPDAADDG